MTRWSIFALAWLAMACWVGVTPAQARPPVQVKVNFNATGYNAHSNGQSYATSPAALTASEKAAILAKAQQKFDEALGPGQVVLSEGTGGDIDMVMNGNSNPALENVYGNAGAACRAGVVYVGRFQNEGFSGTGLTNAASETLAHEIAHKLGVTYHWDHPSLLMSNGVGLTKALRAADSRPFRTEDARIMTENLANPCNDPFSQAPDAGTEAPRSFNPQLPGDDPADETSLDANLTFTGPTGSQFGYMSSSGDFVFQGDTDTPDQRMGFLYEYAYDFAVRLDNGTIISIGGAGVNMYELQDLSPYASQPDVYLTLIETFATPQGPAVATFTVINPDFGGGFMTYTIPEPSSLASLVAGGLLLLRRRRA